MTVAAQPRQIAMALDVIRPFAESSDPRLRGNAVVALTALVDESKTDLTDDATVELVRILCAEPGGIGLDWQRRFAGISINAIGDLDARRSGLIGSRMFEQMRDSREPLQQTAIARLILTACDHGRQHWPISWWQFRRCAILAGRPGFWQCVWAALWRISIVWVVLFMGAAAINERLESAKVSTDELVGTAVWAGTLTAFALAFVMQLSIPGNLRPPRQVYVRDIVFNAILFGLLVPSGVLAMLPWDNIVWSIDRRQLALNMLGLLLLAAVVAAALRCMRWVSALTVLEPDGTSYFVRPATALGISTLACVAAAYVGMDAMVAAAAFLVIVPAAVVLALLDIWLEETGPRTLLPTAARKERRWVLLILAAVSIVGTCVFLRFNPFRPTDEGSLVPVGEVTISPDDEPVAAQARLGESVKVHVIKDGDFTIASSGPGAAAAVRVTDSRRVNLEPRNEAWHLAAGNYSACTTIKGANWCAALQRSSLLDHLAWAFGKFEARPAVTLTFSPNPKDSTQ